VLGRKALICTLRAESLLVHAMDVDAAYMQLEAHLETLQILEDAELAKALSVPTGDGGGGTPPGELTNADDCEKASVVCQLYEILEFLQHSSDAAEAARGMQCSGQEVAASGSQTCSAAAAQQNVGGGLLQWMLSPLSGALQSIARVSVGAARDIHPSSDDAGLSTAGSSSTSSRTQAEVAVTCGICLESLPASSMVYAVLGPHTASSSAAAGATPPCAHSFCVDCMRQYVRKQVRMQSRPQHAASIRRHYGRRRHVAISGGGGCDQATLH